MTAAKNTSPPKTVPAIAPIDVPELLVVVDVVAEVVEDVEGKDVEEGVAVDDGDESSMHD